MQYRTFLTALTLTILSSQVGFAFHHPDATNPMQTITRSMQSYEGHAEERIEKVMCKILAVPKDERTYENTLGEWEWLIETLSYKYQELIARVDPGEQFDAQRANWQARVATKLSQNQELYQTLAEIAWVTMNDIGANHFQRYVSSCFLQNSRGINNKSQPMRMRGACAQKNRIGTKGFTILNLPIGALFDDETPVLTESLLSSDVDIICAQKILNVETSHELFEALRNHYAHFYFLINTCGQEFAGGIPLMGTNIMIASKYPLENVTFHDFHDDTFYADEGFLDFFVQVGEQPRGRVYVEQIRNGKSDHLKMSQLTQIMQHILFAHVMTRHKEEVPVFLCTALSLGKNSHAPVNTFMNSYFWDLDYILKLDEFPSVQRSRNCSDSHREQRYDVQAYAVSLTQNHRGLLSTVRETNSDCLVESFDNIHLSEGSTDVSFHVDSETGSTVDVSASTSTETESGNTVTLETNATASRDNSGNTSGQIEFSVSYSW